MLPRTLALGLALSASLSVPLAVSAASPAGSGAALFLVNCAACHQANGEGIKGIFPPLAQSDFLMADKERSIRIAIQGISGPL
ncbi:MAG: c-type cytochrome, partial [Verrucomicrobia bacterium]|nr:c-type cytochrome [Verrucomicrobiota bacterium]